MRKKNNNSQKNPKIPNKKKTEVLYVVNKQIQKCSKEMFALMRRLQNSTEFLIRKAPFIRLVKEIIQSHSRDFRITIDALEALQLIAETYLVELFIDANACAAHAKRVTVKPIDIKLVGLIRGVVDPGFDHY